MRGAAGLAGLILSVAVLSVRCGTGAPSPDGPSPVVVDSLATEPSDGTGARVAASPAEPAPASAQLIDFESEVRPILARCQPCHFEGGVMYERLPFDRAETVHRLGTKLFTRVKDESEQATIRAFLEQGG